MADRIMVIEDGKIASIGATDEILPQLLGKTADSYSCLTADKEGGKQYDDVR